MIFSMEKILLLLKSKKDFQLLREYLKNNYEILTLDTIKNSFNSEIDLCITDGIMLNENMNLIRKLKSNQKEIYLPVLLVTTKRMITIITSNIWEIIDDLITIPVIKRELYARVEMLLRVRRFSKEVIQFKEKNIEKLKYSLDLIKKEENVLFQNLPVAVYSLDEDGKVLLWNNSSEKILGWKKEEIIGKTFPYLDEKKVKDIIERVMSGKSIYQVELKRKRKDGGYINTLLSASPIKDFKNKIVGTIYVEENITEKLNFLKQLKKETEEKTALIRELYHRVKNNMYLILSMLELKAYSLNNKEIIDFAKEIASKIEAMALVHQKLYQSKDLTKISFHEYIAEVVILFKERYNKAIDVKLELDNLYVSLDIGIPFGIILNELFLNSIKHAFPDNRKGEIYIKMKSYKNKRVKFSFEDNGIGVNKNFDFYSKSFLGLQTIIGIVKEQLKGKINFRSDLNKGLGCNIYFRNRDYKTFVYKT